MLRRVIHLACLALVVVLAWPAAAGAHAIIRESGSEVSFLSDDATSLDTLTIRADGARLALRDPTVDGGMDIGSCEPGETSDRGFVIEAFCRLAGITLLRVDVGDREDTFRTDLPIRVLLFGGDGADVLVTGPADDTVVGETGADELTSGAGNDSVTGGLGADRVDAGPGDDTINVRDGIADEVRCGDGADEVDADTTDTVAGDCESVSRTATPPPAEASDAADTTAPRVSARGAKRQRLRGSGIRLRGSSSERGTMAASGFLELGGERLPVRSRRIKLSSADENVAVPIRLSRSQLARARRALSRGRRVSVRVTVVVTDAAGNSGAARAVRVRLRR